MLVECSFEVIQIQDGDIIFGAEAAPFEMEDLESLGKQRTGFLDSIGPAQVPEVTTPPAAILAETPWVAQKRLGSNIC